VTPEEQEITRLQWAAIMLALDPGTCASILRGLRVRASSLDAVVLRRALRGGELPHPNEYIQVGTEMLEAVSEAGPLPARQKGRKR
jgi:hypothetical protein